VENVIGEFRSLGKFSQLLSKLAGIANIHKQERKANINIDNLGACP
jgi:hypothetical protein